jgi:hypothetical protein
VAKSSIRAVGFVLLLAGATVADAQAPAVYTADRIQSELDEYGYCQLPPGKHRLDRPIELRARQRLCGSGPASILEYVGPGDWAVLFGDRGAPNYACYLDSLTLSGGGLWCRRFAQHCGVDQVWVSGAPSDGVRIDGIGDKFLLRDVVSYGNTGHGFALRAAASNNGLTLDHCNAQANGGHGVLMETLSWGGTLYQTVLRDCTVQGNGAAGRVDCDVLVRGYVGALRVESTWIESTFCAVGLRTVGRLERHPSTGKESLRFPRILITGNSVVSLADRALEFVDCWQCEIEQLDARPAAARVYWRSRPDGTNATGSTRPTGLMRLLDPARIVADSTLEMLGGAKNTGSENTAAPILRGPSGS